MSTLRLRIAADWEERGLCRQVDPDLFYPAKGDSAEPAKSICLLCEVRPQCLKESLERDERHGVWGGLSENERDRLVTGRNTVPLGCAHPGCGVPRRRHDATDHRYQVPDMATVLARADALKKTRRAAA